MKIRRFNEDSTDDREEIQKIEQKLPIPEKIWVNIYNPIKTNSWDIHTSEKSAVVNSIGAPTHCYIHESLCGNVPKKLNEYNEIQGADFKKELSDLATKINQFQSRWGVNFEDFTITQVVDAGLKGTPLKRSKF